MVRNTQHEPKMFKHILLHGYDDSRAREYVTEKIGIAGSDELLDLVHKASGCAHAFNLSSVRENILRPVAKVYNLFPPFSSVWIEGVAQDSGILVIVVNNLHKSDKQEAITSFLCFLFIQGHGKVYGPVHQNMFRANCEGLGFADKRCEFIAKKGISYKSVTMICGEEEDRKMMDSITVPVVLNFLKLVNANNISFPIRKYDINTYNTRALKKRNMNNRYHVLKIHKPGEKVIGESTDTTNEGNVPLHTVRGHLRTYDTKGLFGKLFGTFFIPSHARGDEKNGTVTKDYALV